MANTIQIKRKTTTGAPSPASLAEGEMCLVVPDAAVYVRSGGSVVRVGNTDYTNTDSDGTQISTDGTGGTSYHLFESGSNWIVKKSVSVNGVVTVTRATPSNNPTETDAVSAWGNRLTLNFS